MEIKQVIDNIVQELNDTIITGQRKRYLKGYLEDLESYSANHPLEINLPTHLELYCDRNPNAPECLTYDV